MWRRGSVLRHRCSAWCATEGVVLAVDEIATDACSMGSHPRGAGLAGDEEIVLEVVDGEGIPDALAGQLPPPAQGLGGGDCGYAPSL